MEQKTYSQLKLKDWMLGVAPQLRSELIERYTGSSLNYVMKRVWTPDHTFSPAFKLKIAVGIDQASQGACDFRDLIDGSEEIDWEYVRHALNRRQRAVTAAQKVLPAVNT